MKKTKFLSILAVGTIFLTTAMPALATGTSTTEVDVSYRTNTSSPTAADWVISYPRKLVVTESNKTARTGVPINFKLLDKGTLTDYTGGARVTITVPKYLPMYTITLEGPPINGHFNRSFVAIADYTGVHLRGEFHPIVILTANNYGASKGKGFAYLDLKAVNAVGEYKGTIKFKFKDQTTP